MEFIIRRPSVDEDEQPIPGAKRKTVPLVDMRTFKTFEEYNNHDYIQSRWPGKWTDRGTNHKIINGGIYREIGSKDIWVMELNRLDDLLAIIEDYGDVTVESKTMHCQLNIIVIREC
jgi:hypothetical protein